MPTHALLWLKRDFRLYDNPALTAALHDHDIVSPVFIFEPSALAAPETSAFHVHAQCDAFNGLAAKLAIELREARTQRIGFAHAEVVATLDKLYAAKPFDSLISHQETGGNRTYERDKAVKRWCGEKGVAWREYLQTGVFRGPLDRDKRHKDWQNFYQRPAMPIPQDLQKLKIPDEYHEWLSLPVTKPPLSNELSINPDKWMPTEALLGAPQNGPLRVEQFGYALTDEQRHYVQPVNEGAAHTTLHSFLHERGLDYSKGMSSPNSAFYRCSRLSVHFAWGTISGRAAYQRTQARMEALRESDLENAGVWRKNLRSFLSRLHWRDHFTQRLETEVEMEHRPLNPNFYELELPDPDASYAAWINGTTGFAMVDACIRCMAVTGYINFRMRSMLTSTAAHMLHLDFRRIDKPMARLYTDYEPGIHLAQLQMQAGMVGINTLRTYSPEKQFTDHDPDAEFVHRWVPELRGYTAKEIAQRDLSQGLGDYPPAIVDRMAQIKIYKKLIGDLKYRPGGREITQAVFEKHGSRRGPRKRKKAASPKS